MMDIDGRGSGTDQRRDPAASVSPPAPFGVPASFGSLKKADRVTVPKRELTVPADFGLIMR
jgi:hypothetical protein